MNQPIPATRKRGKPADRWGMKPARFGRVRGQIRNLRRSGEVSDYGELIVYDFDLFIDEGVPPVAVRMRGTDFSDAVGEGAVVEVPDRDPAQRPIVVNRLDFPPMFNHEIIAYYPGRDQPPPGRSRLAAWLIVALPLAVGLGMVELYYVFLR